MSGVTINLYVSGDGVQSQHVPTAEVPDEPVLPVIPGLLTGDAITLEDDELEADDDAETAWHEMRRGRMTCSRFGDLIGSGRKKDAVFTETGYTYLREIAAERLGAQAPTVKAAPLTWGHEHEPRALERYAEATGNDVRCDRFQFFVAQDGSEFAPGGTPDATVRQEGRIAGCVEVKCPYTPSTHLNTLLTEQVPDRYIWQVHGHMLVTGAEWCDFVSFDPRVTEPRLQLAVIRVDRDEKRQAILRKRLADAEEIVQAYVTRLRGKG